MKTTIITTVLLFAASFVAISNPTNIEIRSKIQSMYKGAVVIEVENENGNIEVSIIHEKKEKEVLFDNLGVWQSTKYGITKSKLPNEIKTIIDNSAYSSYRIEEVDVIETPTESLYEIELDKLFSDEITIYITSDGKIL